LWGVVLLAAVLAGGGNEACFLAEAPVEAHEILVGIAKLVSGQALGSSITIRREMNEQ